MNLLDKQLLIETSSRGGFVALSGLSGVLASAALDDAQRQARDLAMKARQLLAEHGTKIRELTKIVVSLGPGSYTGLRVGLASAKALAYGIGVPLIAVPTFHALAEDLPNDAFEADIVADALQGRVFHQRFRRCPAWLPESELKIVPIADLNCCGVVAGPMADRINAARQIPLARPSPQGLWKAAQRINGLNRTEMFAVEPLYLQGSSAEEKRRQSAKAESASARVS